MRWQAPHGGWCRSCETSPAEFVQPRVRTPHERDLRRPLRRPYRRLGFPPTCATSDTPCRSPASAAKWNNQRWTTTRTPTPAGVELGPSQPPECLHSERLDGRTSSPGSRCRNIVRLEGSPPARARESANSQPHPGCLPPSETRDSFREPPARCPRSRGCPPLVGLSRHLCDQ
jgi:hypothetical protein